MRIATSRRIHYAIAILVACASGCTKPAEHLRAVKHSGNGLTLAMPDSMDLGAVRKIVVAQTETGFKVNLADQETVRYVTEATVDLQAGVPGPGEWPEERTIDGRTIHYRIEEEDGGSGGTEYLFLAWESCPAGHIAYRQFDQAEKPAGPRFDLVWKVIEGSRAPAVINN